jgi:hypothetical protein
MRNLAALVCGLATSFATVAAFLAFERLTDVDLFGLVWLFVVPIGAFLAGLFAASGYYFGAIAFHARPTRTLAWGMVFVAGLMQFTLYLSRYLTTQVEGAPVSDLISFGDYVSFVLSHTEMNLRAGSTLPGVQLGALGYALAVFQFLALLAGGLGVYGILADRPFCANCERYARKVERHEGGLRDPDLARGLAELRSSAPLSDEYFASLAPPAAGTVNAVEVDVLSCPECARRVVFEKPKVLEGGKWAYRAAENRTLWV